MYKLTRHNVKFCCLSSMTLNLMLASFQNWFLGKLNLPWVKVSNGLQRVGAPQQLIQQADDISKAWSLGPILEPALQHQLVNG